ncbi:4-alpha-glucanotransferase [Mangrovactinospora gilvigrisea]|uniref:4-alpha-glucanotransferase n=1 Tax=Mangrovactinospora gilvigrisea TaxID=1428644 RepID=A0A1J7BGB1_9ACTN|nr:4-alpha-glucanotransferase [Mangrovactinospora gilvigrisea]OIV37707.1 4-alpha-glucanotransferase [Mangrovactinospora gilvigrisea]
MVEPHFAPVPEDLAALAAEHGVATAYRAAGDRHTHVSATAVRHALAALGVDPDAPPARRRRRRPDPGALPACLAGRAGRAVPLPDGSTAPLRLRLEDGTVRDLPAGTTALPPDLPPGYHALATPVDEAPLIVAPARLAPPPRAWGWLAQLYSVLSHRSWGMGDLADLAELASWAGAAGAGFVQINPLHAAPPTPSADPSPYRPATRAFPDPVYLAVDRIPEADALPPAHRARLDQLAEQAAAYRHAVLLPNDLGDTQQLINRDAVWRIKREALTLLHAAPRGDAREAAYRAYLDEAGPRLTDHATWCALTEAHGPDFRAWPAGLREPGSTDTVRFRTAHPVSVDFHRWLAWLTDTQLAEAQHAARAAGMPLGVVHDLAVGAHPDGSDAWALGGPGGVIAERTSIGSPPDAFNPHGQNWGLPPWRPDALARTGYAPFRDLIRRALRHAGGLRVDHVMGLFRLWWIPDGEPPTHGTYVHYDHDALLGVLAIEAERAGAAVIGEDLGTVEPAVRRELADRGILGTGVLWFERAYETDGHPKRPEEWRELCLATLTTHDLPSTAARLTGDHLALRHRLGLLPGDLSAERAEDAADREEWLDLLRELGLLDKRETGEEEQVLALHRFLRRTPARLTGAWLPDATGDRRPQNLPGTVDEYPNWRLPMADPRGRPVTLDELRLSPRASRLVEALNRDAP